MNNELRVRKSPHGTLVVYEMRSPMSVGWRVVHVGAGDTRLQLGYWVTDQEAATWQAATWCAPPPPQDACTRCNEQPITHRPCCSSHGRDLCCDCYRRTHFVEVGNCCSAWAQTCTTTHSVATGYGVLDCDGDHSGDGMHHDRKHRLVWSACHEDCCGGAS